MSRIAKNIYEKALYGLGNVDELADKIIEKGEPDYMFEFAIKTNFLYCL